MITVDKNVDATSKVVVYKDLFSDKALSSLLKEIYRGNPVVVSLLRTQLLKITGKLYEQKQNKKPVSTVCILLEDYLHFTKGSMIILGKEKIKLPKISIHMYEYRADLPEIYRTTDERLKYSKHVKTLLSDVKRLPVWEQCLQKHLRLGSFLGKGSYGNVFNFSDNFAVKLSKIKDDARKTPFDPNFNSWHEVYILENILRRIITAKVCPNLPLIYESFACKNCKLALDNKQVDSPCAITAVELAQGTLKTYLKENPSLQHLHSAFFQILAGISAIQYYGQIMNFDVKKENVLYYNVKPGGYWHYRIRGIDFYVPNYGKLFVLNDFGISRTMSPHFPTYKSRKDRTYRLGSRYAFISGGKFVPLDSKEQTDENFKPKEPNKVVWDGETSSGGAEFRMDRGGKILPVKLSVGIEMTEDILLNSDLCPPFEFYNDTQDALRMFLGGKRTTQKGDHSKPEINKTFADQLRKFEGEGASLKNGVFSTDPSQVLASFLIVSFFTEFTDYREKTGKENKIIESFFYPNK